MEKKNTIFMVLMLGLLVGSSSPAAAAAGWETNLLLSAGPAESRLSLGQRADATNLVDGRYDVPAMPNGSLRAAFTGGGGELWRDIRVLGRDREEWGLAITSSGDQPVKIAWDATKLPTGYTFELIDEANAQVIAMGLSSAYMVTSPAAGLVVRVTKK